MNKNYELVRKVVADANYRVLEDDGKHVVIKYQMNVIHIYPSSGDDQFVSILLPSFDDVAEENIAGVVTRCHRLNETLKQVKLYTVNDILVASAEFFYMAEADLAYQVKTALESVLTAKVAYRKME